MIKRGKIAVAVVLMATATSICLTQYVNVKANKLDHSTGSSETYYDTETHEYYFYQLTSETDRENYRKIQQALLNRDEEVKLKKVNTFDKVQTLVLFVLNDHPEIFWFDNINEQKIDLLENGTVKFRYTLNTDEEIKEAEKEILWYVTDLKVASIKRGMTDYEKEVAIYDYISKHSKFDVSIYFNGGAHSQSIYSAAKGETVCRGFSLMFKYICNQYGIPCIVVGGNNTPSIEVNNQNINHSWNEVMIDGDWYVVDLTDSRKSVYGGMDLDTTFYKFNITTEYLKKYASVNGHAIVPECTSTKYDYYKMTDTYFEEADLEKYKELVEERDKIKNKKKHYLFTRCANEEVFNKLITLINEDEMWTEDKIIRSDDNLYVTHISW